MELDKIELLVNKIDKAINIIQELKNENSRHLEQINRNEEDIKKLSDENKRLRNDINSKNKEINKTDELHKILEDKIQKILQYLPAEEDPVKEHKKERAKKRMPIKMMIKRD